MKHTLHHYLDMSHLQVVRRFLLVIIHMFKCQVKVSCMCCQLTRRVHIILISTSCIQLLSLQLRIMSKDISLFSAPYFNQCFRDNFIDLQTISLKCAIHVWIWRYESGTIDWLKRSVGGWITCKHICSNSQTWASIPGLPSTPWGFPCFLKVERRSFVGLSIDAANYPTLLLRAFKLTSMVFLTFPTSPGYIFTSSIFPTNKNSPVLLKFPPALRTGCSCATNRVLWTLCSRTVETLLFFILKISSLKEWIFNPTRL